MWIYNDKRVANVGDLPDNAIGFIYQITNKDNGKHYIGMKELYMWKTCGKSKFLLAKERGDATRRYKNKSKSKPGAPVWVHQVRGERDWLTYNGSNAELLEDIKNGANLSKEIWETAECKKKLTFLELEALIKMDVLRDAKNYYNSNILGKFFPRDITCQYGSEEDTSTS